MEKRYNEIEEKIQKVLNNSKRHDSFLEVINSNKALFDEVIKTLSLFNSNFDDEIINMVLDAGEYQHMLKNDIKNFNDNNLCMSIEILKNALNIKTLEHLKYYIHFILDQYVFHRSYGFTIDEEYIREFLEKFSIISSDKAEIIYSMICHFFSEKIDNDEFSLIMTNAFLDKVDRFEEVFTEDSLRTFGMCFLGNEYNDATKKRHTPATYWVSRWLAHYVDFYGGRIGFKDIKGNYVEFPFDYEAPLKPQIEKFINLVFRDNQKQKKI